MLRQLMVNIIFYITSWCFLLFTNALNAITRHRLPTIFLDCICISFRFVCLCICPHCLRSSVWLSNIAKRVFFDFRFQLSSYYINVKMANFEFGEIRLCISFSRCFSSSLHMLLIRFPLFLSIIWELRHVYSMISIPFLGSSYSDMCTIKV